MAKRDWDAIRLFGFRANFIQNAEDLNELYEAVKGQMMSKAHKKALSLTYRQRLLEIRGGTND